MTTGKRMAFRRFGRAYHLRIDTPEDLAGVLELDEAHWVATGAPVDTLNGDRTFFDLVDTDRNGRIMCFEVREAIAWLLENLSDTSGVATGNTALTLASVDAGTSTGQRILQSAGKMLARLGCADAAEIRLDQVRKIKAEVEGRPVSEAGVVLPEATADESIRQFILDVIAAVGGADHPSGRPGVGQQQLDCFLAEARAYLQWRAGALVPADGEPPPTMPLGEATPRAFAILAGLREKIDQYFVQCEAVAFDGRLAACMTLGEADRQVLDLSDPKAIDELIRRAPLAEPQPAGVLDLDGPINPRWAAQVARLRSEVVEPALGRAAASLSQADWQQVKQTFAAHEAWSATKAGHVVEALGAEKLSAYLDAPFRQAVEDLIGESARTGFVLDNIRLTEQLVLYQAYLPDLANNFVSFPHLYDPASRATFEMGTLVMDGRHFTLAVKVADRARHAAMAKTSNMFLLYVEVAPRGGGQRYVVAVPVTSGGKGNLCVGKRGLFQDIHGDECDAVVVGIIDNPISLCEALASPFIRIGRLVTGKIESLATQAEKKLDKRTTAALTDLTAAAPPAKQPAKRSPIPLHRDWSLRPSAAPAPAAGAMPAGGLVMGFSVAAAALGSALAFITKTLSETNKVAIALGVLAAVALVMLPTSIIAILKLRKRDLSAILEGSGWAINARMRLTCKQGIVFTRRPRYPLTAAGIQRRRILWALGIVIAAAALAAGGGILDWLLR